MKTKLSILFSLLFILSSSISIAQKDKDDDKIGGIRAGWQSSNLFVSGAQTEGFDPLSSFYVGLFRENKIIPLLALGTGFEYFQVGSVNNTLDSKFTLHYLSIPIDLRVKLGPVFALAGFAANFRVGENQRVLGVDIDVTDESKSEYFDLPVFFGIGVNILMLRLEARYHWGLIDVYKATDVSEGIKSQYFQLGLGVSF